MKRKVCFVFILFVFLFSTKDVFASRDAMLILKDKINENNYGEKLNELDPSIPVELLVIANSYGDSIKVDIRTPGDEIPPYLLSSIGILTDNILTFNIKEINLYSNYFDEMAQALLTYLAMDAYGELIGLDRYYLFNSIMTLIENVLAEYNGELEYFIYENQGINLFQSGIDSVTVTLDLDLIEVPEEEIIDEEVVDEVKEDIKEDVKEEVIDVNPPTAVNTHYLSLSLTSFILMVCLKKLKKQKYL